MNVLVDRKDDKVIFNIIHQYDVKAYKAKFTSAFADFKDMLHQRLVEHVEDVK